MHICRQVRPHAVVFKVQAPGEALFTIWTRVRLRVGRVEPPVPHHVAPPLERQTTHVTLVRFLLCVDHYVGLEGGKHSEACRTQFANKGPLSCVRSLVPGD